MEGSCTHHKALKLSRSIDAIKLRSSNSHPKSPRDICSSPPRCLWCRPCPPASGRGRPSSSGFRGRPLRSRSPRLGGREGESPPRSPQSGWAGGTQGTAAAEVKRRFWIHEGTEVCNQDLRISEFCVKSILVYSQFFYFFLIDMPKVCTQNKM